MKDLLIVSADPMNMTDVFREAITSHSNQTFDCLDHFAIRKSFRYKNFSQRAYNFFLKNLTGRNIKHEHYNSSVERAMENLEHAYKKILVICPDLISDHHLQMLRGRTGCLIAYYWDKVDLLPCKRNIVPYFDRILSFDPEDCKKYCFQFQPNFYYYENCTKETRYQVYNLSTVDHRQEIIEEIAAAMEKVGLSYLLKGFSEKPFTSEFIQPTDRISYSQMLNEARYCDVVLDVAKPGQKGLSFRPFEALGLNKKLITTNAAIKEYGFYDPQNVLIVEPGKVHLDTEFFEQPFKEIPVKVREKYHIRQWLNSVLNEQAAFQAESNF